MNAMIASILVTAVFLTNICPSVSFQPPAAPVPTSPTHNLLSLISGPDTSNRDVRREINELMKLGKGFDPDTVQGRWIHVWTISSKKSPKSEGIFIGNDKKMHGKEQSNFPTPQTDKFYNLIYTRRGNGKLTVVDTYQPVREGFTKTADGRVTLRRVMCDVTSAYFKYGRLPSIPLPIRLKGGFLDFLYLDNNVRVTRGNLGGLFVHVRENVVREYWGDCWVANE